MTRQPLGWIGIVRLGLVQSAIGSIVMFPTSLLNRVMVVEYALPAALPAGLIAWHYVVQLSRPVWGHGSDSGRRRTPWIVGGMALLAAGVMLAVQSVALLSGSAWVGYTVAILAFTMVGAGVGAAGTSLLALLATRVAPARRAAAASVTWIMMIAGIVVSSKIAGNLIDPFSFVRLELVVAAIVGCAFLVSVLALWDMESAPASRAQPDAKQQQAFFAALIELWGDLDARRFTIFVFLSMFAYSMQDLILEPFVGLRFGMTPGQSTELSSTQHSGVLLGMILIGVGGSVFSGAGAGGTQRLQRWIVGGCIGSGLALTGLAMAARFGPGWPIVANIFLLGFANGVFAVAAIGTMMALAGAGGPQEGGGREGVRMGVWGAAQALAFGLGGLTGAVAVDAGRALTGKLPETFMLVFAAEALLFLVAAALCLRTAPSRASSVGREVTI